MSVGMIMAVVFMALIMIAFIGANIFIIIHSIKKNDKIDAILAGVVVTLYTSAFIISIIL
ncbi:hypothetical protein [Staphylococcus phage vB_SsapH-Golestan-100]|nr:hypothetical protein [Staphylococcus phage vB_SsapH-Golestan-100]